MDASRTVAVDGRPVTSDYTPDEIRQATKAFKKHTSIGCDNVCFRFIRMLPDQALESLGSILTVVKRLILPPLQILNNLMATIPKRAGGTRTIAVAATFYRLPNFRHAEVHSKSYPGGGYRYYKYVTASHPGVESRLRQKTVTRK